MKHIYNLLFFLVVFGCSKREYVETTASDSNEWKLISLQSKVVLNGHREIDPTYILPEKGYFSFVNDNLIETNIVMDGQISNFLSIGSKYTSNYNINDEVLSTRINDEDYQQKIPLNFTIKYISQDKMVLSIDSHDLKKVFSYYNELDGEACNNMIINWLTSAQVEIVFKK